LVNLNDLVLSKVHKQKTRRKKHNLMWFNLQWITSLHPL